MAVLRVSSPNKDTRINNVIMGLIEMPFLIGSTSNSVIFRHGLGRKPIVKVYLTYTDSPDSKWKLPIVSHNGLAGGVIDTVISYRVSNTELEIYEEFYAGDSHSRSDSYFFNVVLLDI